MDTVQTFWTGYTIGNHGVEGSSFVVIVKTKSKHTALEINLASPQEENITATVVLTLPEKVWKNYAQSSVIEGI
jgi:hypothetical protein